MTLSMHPKISIVTPSFNQAHYIGETIESVLDQAYPNLEYIVIDGGSTDGSVDIIKKYERHLAYWVSERDRGQSHAINKGLDRATGEILAYLNSDDVYLPGALESVADAFSGDPSLGLVHGRCRIVDEHGNKIGERCAAIENYEQILDLWGVWWQKRNFVQPEVFWTRTAMDRVGNLREDLNYVMDYEFWVRLLKSGTKLARLDAEISAFRIHSAQKTQQAERVADELLEVVRPLIWDGSPHLSWGFRQKLKGQWCLDRVFRPAAEAKGHGVTERRRILNLTKIVLTHPELLHSRGFRSRMIANLKGRIFP